MYSQDVQRIRREWRKRGSDVLVSTVDFVLATIQQQFSTVPTILREWEDQGLEAPSLWGNKTAGWLEIRERQHEIHAELMSLTLYDKVEAIDTLMTISGLGTVKAAFVAQCLGWDVGCIDTHNARHYDIDVKTFATSHKQTAKTRLAKIGSYVKLCEDLGGAEHLWDSWCYFIADKYPAHFTSGEAVSQMHVDCILS